MKYRKKPVVVEAIQWNGENEQELKEFVGDDLIIELIREPQITENGVIPKCVKIQIKTLEGIMLASLNDYIIKGINEEFYPCKPDIFEKTYEDNLETSNAEKVFEMLGVKAYERFEIKFERGYLDEKIIRYFYDDKLGLHNEVKDVTSYLGNMYLSEILCGIHKIIKLPPEVRR